MLADLQLKITTFWAIEIDLESRSEIGLCSPQPCIGLEQNLRALYLRHGPRVDDLEFSRRRICFLRTLLGWRNNIVNDFNLLWIETVANDQILPKKLSRYGYGIGLFEDQSFQLLIGTS